MLRFIAREREVGLVGLRLAVLHGRIAATARSHATGCIEVFLNADRVCEGFVAQGVRAAVCHTFASAVSGFSRICVAKSVGLVLS